MEKITKSFDRRNFIKTTTTLTTGLTGIALFSQTGWGMDKSPEDSIHIIGPKKGYSPQIGTLVSMLIWMREVVTYSVRNMTQEQLDYLHDAKSNTIGALLLHLAATDAFYHVTTFEGRQGFNDIEKARFGAAWELGDQGRKMIKGNNLNYYLDILKDTREKTLAAFRKHDDKWLMKVDPRGFSNKPTNNYCKWFHVCEHESNHNGQIKWIKSRIPGVKHDSD